MAQAISRAAAGSQAELFPSAAQQPAQKGAVTGTSNPAPKKRVLVDNRLHQKGYRSVLVKRGDHVISNTRIMRNRFNIVGEGHAATMARCAKWVGNVAACNYGTDNGSSSDNTPDTGNNTPENKISSVFGNMVGTDSTPASVVESTLTATTASTLPRIFPTSTFITLIT